MLKLIAPPGTILVTIKEKKEANLPGFYVPEARKSGIVEGTLMNEAQYYPTVINHLLKESRFEPETLSIFFNINKAIKVDIENYPNVYSLKEIDILLIKVNTKE